MQEERIKEIGRLSQLAAALEACADKPGNVGPAAGFADSSFADFLSGALALGGAIEEAARRGFIAGKSGDPSSIGVGGLILSGIRDIRKAHSGGNTHLGTLLLYVPIAAAVGHTLSCEGDFSNIGKAVSEIVCAAGRADSQSFYLAIKECGCGGVENLEEPNVGFGELMETSSKKDRIASELRSGMRITLEEALPRLKKSLEEKDLLAAIADTYLSVLSRFPDTLIEKKAGIGQAREVSRRAEAVLSGKIPAKELDLYLRENGNLLNPGATADIISAALFLMLLEKQVFCSGKEIGTPPQGTGR